MYAVLYAADCINRMDTWVEWAPQEADETPRAVDSLDVLMTAFDGPSACFMLIPDAAPFYFPDPDTQAVYGHWTVSVGGKPKHGIYSMDSAYVMETLPVTNFRDGVSASNRMF